MTVDIGGEGATSPVKILANIFISFIGAGVLGLPYAFKEAGILEGVFIMTFVGVVSVKAMLLLIDCKYKLIHKSPSHNSVPSKGRVLKVQLNGEKATLEEHVELMVNDEKSATDQAEPSKPPAAGKDLNYGDLGYYALGNIGKTLVDITIVISQVGFCCAYLIFICENLSDYIHGLRLIHWLCMMLPPLALLTFLRHLSSLAISSLFAQLSNLLAFAVVFWFDFEHFATVKIHPKEISIAGFPFFLAVAIYCYEGAGMILSLESSLAPSIRHKFKAFFKTMMFIVTSLYIVFGASGYLSFGSETNEIITLNLPKGSSLDFAMVVKSCLCLALFFTYPVMMFPVIRILEAKLLSNPPEQILKGNVLRVLMVLLTGVVVLAVPNFANLMALIGATCCSLLAFILPGIFHYQIFKGSLTKCEVVFDVFLITMGIAGSIVGTMDALVRLHGTHTGNPITTSRNHTADALLEAMSPSPIANTRNIIGETVQLMINSTKIRGRS